MIKGGADYYAIKGYIESHFDEVALELNETQESVDFWGGAMQATISIVESIEDVAEAAVDAAEGAADVVAGAGAAVKSTGGLVGDLVDKAGPLAVGVLLYLLLRG